MIQYVNYLLIIHQKYINKKTFRKSILKIKTNINLYINFSFYQL